MNTIKEITYYECSDGSVFKNHILAEKYIKFCDLINAIEVRYLNNEKEQYKHYIQQDKMNVCSLIHDVCVYGYEYLPTYKEYFVNCMLVIISVQELYNAVTAYSNVKVLNNILNRILCISKISYREYDYMYFEDVDAHHVYIKGNIDDGKKIIKYLEEEFNGINQYKYDGCDDLYYFIDGNNVINCKTASFLLPNSYHEIELPTHFF